jgi:hypothetical protein
MLTIGNLMSLSRVDREKIFSVHTQKVTIKRNLFIVLEKCALTCFAGKGTFFFQSIIIKILKININPYHIFTGFSKCQVFQ